jgi:hypothetical protein
MLRYELKFSEDELLALTTMEVWLARQPYIYEAYPERSVHSLYFDNPSLQCASDNLNGSANRQKFRLRWYTDPTDDVPHGPATFERKIRVGVLGTKRSNRSSLDGRRLLAGSRNEILRASLEDPGFVETFQCTDLEPSLYVRYERSYFATPDGIRFTIDRGVRFGDVLASRHNWWSGQAQSKWLVVEVKHAPEWKDSVAAMLVDFPLRRYRHSKYMLGLSFFSYVNYL